jgi:Fe2+ or Zn2+ uptake regulation protein
MPRHDPIHDDVVARLTAHKIRASAQRVAIARYVLATVEHPSADRVWEKVRERFPMVSRATVYNTLKLLVKRGLLRMLEIAPDSTVFDPMLARHHHLVDSGTGRIHDVPWDSIQVGAIDVKGFEVEDYQVVVRARRKRPAR